jgi:hypothetical protein
MKKKKNIFENKLQELNKLKVESKKEVLAKEQKAKDEKKEFEEYCEAETRKYLKEFDKERSDLKKFIKEVNKKFYKKYEINVINPPGLNRDGLFCKDTGGYNATYFVNSRIQFKKMFEVNIFSICVLDKPFNNKDQTTTDIRLSYKDSIHFQWPSRFKVEVGDQMFSSGKNTNKDFFLKDHGSKARKLAIEEFINRLTDHIKLL